MQLLALANVLLIAAQVCLKAFSENNSHHSACLDTRHQWREVKGANLAVFRDSLLFSPLTQCDTGQLQASVTSCPHGVDYA